MWKATTEQQSSILFVCKPNHCSISLLGRLSTQIVRNDDITSLISDGIVRPLFWAVIIL
jgi:regulator of RNase E activity RraA